MPPLYSMPSAKKRHNHAGTTDERTQPISDHSEAAKHPQEAWRLERGCWVIHQSIEWSLFSWLWCWHSWDAWWCEKCIYAIYINSKQKHVMVQLSEAAPLVAGSYQSVAFTGQKCLRKKNKLQTAVNLFLSCLYHGLSAQCCQKCTKNIKVYFIPKNYCWDWFSTYAPKSWYATSTHDDTWYGAVCNHVTIHKLHHSVNIHVRLTYVPQHYPLPCSQGCICTLPVATKP